MARLGDICIQITDGSHNPPMGVEQSNYLMLSSKNIDDDHITFNDPRYLSQEDFEAENKRTNIKPNDLLITIVGTIGRVAIVPNSLTEFCVQRSVAVLKPKPEMVYNRFLMYYLQNMRPYLEQESRGVAQKGIYLKQLSNLSIILPPLDEQRKIAAVLDKVSDLIAKRRQQLDKLDELIKARFVEMFGTLQDPQSNFPVVSIDSVCSLIKDGTHQTPKYTDDTENGFKFLSSKDVMTQKISWDNIKYIPAELHERLYAVIQPQRNDILMSKNGVNYGVAAVNDSDEIFDIYVSLALLRPTSKINPVYFRCAINNPDTKRQFDNGIKGIGVPNLHLNEIKKTKILLPPLSMQSQFATFVEQTEKTKTTISKSLEKLETLKKALMQEYFG